MRKRLLVLVITGLLAAAPALGESWAEDYGQAMERPAPTWYEKLVDAVLIRPGGLAPTLTAAVGCALGLPVAWFFGSPVEMRQVCLEDPLEFTFTRPLGEL